MDPRFEQNILSQMAVQLGIPYDPDDPQGFLRAVPEAMAAREVVEQITGGRWAGARTSTLLR